MQIAPAPLYRDPIYNGPTDPTIIWNRQEKTWWIVYTSRRATDPCQGVAWVHGTALGAASSDDGGKTWIYRGTLNLEPTEPGMNTYWAPEIIWHEGLYHMYVSYITGVPSHWNRPRHILHYTSGDLWNWAYQSTLDSLGDKVIDACLYPLPSGGFRMFYKDENAESHTWYADSPDLYTWQIQGEATSDCNQEGPNVFELGGETFLIADMWDGMAVYKSTDLTHWQRQPYNLLSAPGTRPEDNGRGHHADVLSFGDHAYIFYFVHPGFRPYIYGDNDPTEIRRSVIQTAELINDHGTLCVLRNENFDFILPDGDAC